jgi:uncharacterized protein (DUF433 family)
MATVSYPHIDIDADGIAWLAGTRTKVLEVVLDRLAHHWDADEIQRQHPHLSLAQIHAAFTYYYDHQEEVDRQIEERARFADQFRQSLPESPALKKLRQLGHAP